MKNNSVSMETVERDILMENEKLFLLVEDMQGPELVLIGLRPGVGKTFLMLTTAIHMAIEKKIPVAYISLEKSKDALLKRIFKISDLCEEEIQNSPLYLFDDQMSCLELEQNIRNINKQKTIKAIFVDYMGLLRTENTELITKQEAYGNLIKKLKNLAKELNLTVVSAFHLHSDDEELYLQETQSIFSYGDTFQYIDKLIFMQKSSIKEVELKVYLRSKNNDWIGSTMQWALPTRNKMSNAESRR